MTKLMTQQPGKFRLIIEREENPSCSGNTSAREGIGIDIGGIDSME